jgi:hypothetical protein
MRKNKMEKNEDHGIMPRAVGNTMNAKPGPPSATVLMQDCCDPAMNPRTENTATPAHTETQQLSMKIQQA